MKETINFLETPGWRYIVVRGRLWRKPNPFLPEEDRKRLVSEPMSARPAVKDSARDELRLRAALALGERGPVWWPDGALDLDRRWRRRRLTSNSMPP
ncbi:hypothetical protein [Pararhizobium sp. PWRC1-1]|uniref:hypothetical protein n=1 Tax=Pararhizobium sp. PWRC1-1 TaxID=2804566 RepID=UPI003CEEC96E